MKLDYLLLDVFTRERLRGNQLAVVLKADGLLDDQMQRIAAEFNLSETVFISKPNAERHTAAVRIFTPQVELPFAGHPTVGAAVVLGLETRSSAIRIEEKIGVITCVIEKIDKARGHARFALPHLPTVAGKAPDKTQLALMLGLEPEDIGFGMHKPSVFSAGWTFYLIPVKSPAVLAQVKPQTGGWSQTFPLEHHSVYVYTETPGEDGNDFAARMFSPGMGLGEEPTTKATTTTQNGELAQDATDGQTEYVLRRGMEMARLSLITMQISKNGDRLNHGGKGGD